jgi:Uma2 family endonuclease
MTPTIAEGPHTPEELLRMPDGNRYDLIDGNLVERGMGAEAGLVAAKIIHLLLQFVDANDLGFVYTSDGGYQIFPGRPKRVRFPDCSFVAHGRLPDDRTPAGHIRIPPDLMVEVVSPNDAAYEVEEKIEEYLEAGVKLLWVVYPNTQRVWVVRLNGVPSRLGVNDELTGDDVIPGFTCRVAQLFAKVSR